MKILIEDKFLKIIDKENLRTGNVNSYKMSIEYDSFYNDRVLMIYFKQDDIKKIVTVGPDNIIDIPHEVLENVRDIYIGFYSPSPDGDKLKDRYCSNFDRLTVIEGAYDKDATPTEELTPTILEKYLQEMKDFYNESLKEYNDNADLKLSEYNNNSIQKVREYNENAHLKKEEIDKVSEEVKKDKSDIEGISEKVRVLEQNAKISENNAKTSEQNAQNSLNKAVEVETNVINIQEDINASKAHIEEQKESVDNSVVKIEKMVEEATNQANISKQQAELSSKNANQTSADKTETKAIKDEVSTMKTSVEQTKSDIEQIKTDTQTIYDDTFKAKEETLKAKENVENSLESERIESDKKYARSIDTDEIEISEYGEVELDEGGYMKDVEISTSKDITQETRKSYNEFNKNDFLSCDGYFLTETGILGKAEKNYSFLLPVEASTTYTIQKEVSDRLRVGVLDDNNLENLVNRVITKFAINDVGTKVTTTTTDTTKYLFVQYAAANFTDKIEELLETIQVTKGTEEKPYEPFNVYMPSFELPGELQNVETSIKINNHQLNCLENQMKSQTLNGLNFNINNDKSISIKGTATVRTEPHVWDKKDDNQLILRKGVTYWNLSGRTLFFNVKKNTYLTINNQKSYTPTEDTEIEYSVYFRFEKDETVDEIVYPFLTTEKDGKYEPFNGGLKKIELENQFLGSFKGYKNYIEKNRFKRNLNILNLTGSEKWQAHINSDYLKTPDESLDFFIQVPSDMKTNSIMLCDKFKFNDFDGGYRSNSNVESISNGGGYRRIYIRIKKDRLDSSDVDGLKKFLKELYEKGDPVKILYITNTEYDDELPAEILDKLNSFNVYKGKNQIDIYNFKLKFKSNRNLQNYIDDQIKLNSSEEIKKYDSRYAKALKIQVDDVKKTKIYVENSQVEELKIEGEEITQNKRLGYNLLINKLTSKTVKGVTFDVQEDGSIILNGTPTETIVINLLTGNESISDVAADSQILKIPDTITKMTLSGCPKNDQSKAFKIDLWSKSGELIGNDSDFGSGIKIDFSSNENWRKINRARIVIYTFAKLNNTVFRPMLTEGTEQKPYEKYGATPSFEFPAEIEPKHPNIEIFNEEESVHIDVNVEAYGIKDFKDEIVKNKLIKYIKKLELTGAEEILQSSRDNLFYIQLDGNIVSTPNVNIKSGLVLSNCFKNESYTDLRNYRKDYGIEVYLNRIYFRILDFNTVEEVKNKLKELYDSNNAVKIYYILSDPEAFELTEEQKQQLDKFKLFDGTNNISIENGKLSFKYNKSISKALSEKDDKINDLQNQINEIKALLNTTNTSALLLSNLENDLESEVK